MQDQENQPSQNPEVEQAEEQTTPVEAPAMSDLETQLSATEAKLAEMHDAFMRAKAEGENIRRRAQEDVAKAHKFAVESFAEAMVPVKDSLEMALKVDTPTLESLKEGVEMTLKQLNSAFERNRLIEVMPAVGEKLDPNKHQAVAMVPAEQEANTVVTVLQKGYMIADRLLRPAIVTAAQPK
ncbi:MULTISPECIES: nucleotide exchange factor GrpE [unclassified Duganella]|uniref:nucleotide exchange factor GrpE n=1 Tax=unclassified Duganella TaxID=2636909 RepID=UPI0006FEF9FB|nr:MULTISPECIES: nucleotide exchange factor GrpE [unclassified Duganella]KQV47640.1 molecular chaperone GrpE [Duganella sp. Root336D2]KRB82072.1 molecular chaperone GrpE [Duganella sp. Root198D2]